MDQKAGYGDRLFIQYQQSRSCIRLKKKVQLLCKRIRYGVFVETCDNNDLFIIRWHFVVNVADQGYPHLSGVVASKNVTDEVCLNLHVDLYLR